MSEASPTAPRRLLRFLRENPVTAAIVVAGAITGAAATVWLPIGPEDWSTSTRVVAGGLAGAWLAMFPLGFRLFD